MTQMALKHAKALALLWRLYFPQSAPSVQPLTPLCHFGGSSQPCLSPTLGLLDCHQPSLHGQGGHGAVGQQNFSGPPPLPREAADTLTEAGIYTGEAKYTHPQSPHIPGTQSLIIHHCARPALHSPTVHLGCELR